MRQHPTLGVFELRHVDPRYGDGTMVEKRKRAMYGTRDATQMWAGVVRSTLDRLGCKESVLQPAVYDNFEKDVIVVVHASAQVMGRPSRGCMWC